MHKSHTVREKKTYVIPFISFLLRKTKSSRAEKKGKFSGNLYSFLLLLFYNVFEMVNNKKRRNLCMHVCASVWSAQKCWMYEYACVWRINDEKIILYGSFSTRLERHKAIVCSHTTALRKEKKKSLLVKINWVLRALVLFVFN